MIPKGMNPNDAGLKLKEIKEASRLALRSCLKVKDTESLDTLTLNAEVAKRWAMFNENKDDGNCTALEKIFVKAVDIPSPIIPQAAQLQFPVGQPQIGRPGPRKGRHTDNAGD